MSMIQVRELRTADEVRENYRAVARRRRERLTPRRQTIAIVDSTPEPVTIVAVEPPKPRKPPYPSIREIIEHVAKKYGITHTDIVSQRRAGALIRPRFVAYTLAKRLTPRSLPDIGRAFGGRDHSTIWHAIRKIEGLALADEALRDELAALASELMEGRRDVD